MPVVASIPINSQNTFLDNKYKTKFSNNRRKQRWQDLNLFTTENNPEMLMVDPTTSALPTPPRSPSHSNSSNSNRTTSSGGSPTDDMLNKGVKSEVNINDDGDLDGLLEALLENDAIGNEMIARDTDYGCTFMDDINKEGFRFLEQQLSLAGTAHGTNCVFSSEEEERIAIMDELLIDNLTKCMKTEGLDCMDSPPPTNPPSPKSDSDIEIKKEQDEIIDDEVAHIKEELESMEKIEFQPEDGSDQLELDLSSYLQTEDINSLMAQFDDNAPFFDILENHTNTSPCNDEIVVKEEANATITTHSLENNVADEIEIKEEEEEEEVEESILGLELDDATTVPVSKGDCMWDNGFYNQSENQASLENASRKRNDSFSSHDLFDEEQMELFKSNTVFEAFDSFQILNHHNSVTNHRKKRNSSCTSIKNEIPLKKVKLSEEVFSSGTTTSSLSESVDIKPDIYAIENFHSAFHNDHSYCEQIKTEASDDHTKTKAKLPNTSRPIQGFVLNNDLNANERKNGVPKKTKILVPLKDLMETLQQKSFLVSPLGPGKKVIRLTGNGETVKGVLGMHKLSNSLSSNGSSTFLSSAQSAMPPKHAHNQRKRPHTINKLMTPHFLSDITTPPSSPSNTTSVSTPSSTPLSTPPGTPMSSSNSSSATGTPPKKKTKAHNNMERLRRVDLRNSFDNLKKLVPPLNKSPKCSKVEILRRAEEYITALRALERKLLKEETAVKARNEQLRSRLAQLNSSNSSSCS